MDKKSCNPTTNEPQSKLERSIEVVKEDEHKGKLLLEENHLFQPSRRSYNEHLGSINFINLLDGESPKGLDCLQANIKSLNLVSNVLDSGDDEMHPNQEKQSFCLPTLINKGSKSFCLKSTSLRSEVQPMEIVSQSEFTSQTLKPFSVQNLESIVMEGQQIQRKNPKYKLKESTPGCLPGKGKSKKLQQRKENRGVNGVRIGSQSSHNEGRQEGDDTDSNFDNNSCDKTKRRKSFLSALKFIKLRKFCKKKKQKEDCCEPSENSNGDIDSVESSSEQKHESRNQDDEFIFGGVRVFIDENGECYEVDEEFDVVSNQSTISEDDSRNSMASYSRTKFESRDSLNLGYSGCFAVSS